MKQKLFFSVFSRFSVVIAIYLLFSAAHYSETRAQSSSQKTPPIFTFHFSGDTDKVRPLSNGKSDKPLDNEDWCCSNIMATLTQALNPCNSITLGKGGTPQYDTSNCCCADLSIWMPCSPQYSLCQIVVTFDQNVLDPLCQVCPPLGWTYNLHSGGQAGQDGVTFQYVGGEPGQTGCSGAIGATPVPFYLCGFNTDGPIGYLVCGYFCISTVTGGCEVDPNSSCCQRFTSTITCPTSGVASIPDSKPFAVDEGFPNPAASSIRFDYTAPYAGALSLTLVDILGKTVSTSNNIIAQGGGNVTINLTGAQLGGYYCVFEFNGERITKRIEIK